MVDDSFYTQTQEHTFRIWQEVASINSKLAEYLLCIINLWLLVFPHFKDEEMKMQQGWVSCPGSQVNLWDRHHHHRLTPETCDSVLKISTFPFVLKTSKLSVRKVMIWLRAVSLNYLNHFLPRENSWTWSCKELFLGITFSGLLCGLPPVTFLHKSFAGSRYRTSSALSWGWWFLFHSKTQPSSSLRGC